LDQKVMIGDLFHLASMAGLAITIVIAFSVSSFSLLTTAKPEMPAIRMAASGSTSTPPKPAALPQQPPPANRAHLAVAAAATNPAQPTPAYPPQRALPTGQAALLQKAPPAPSMDAGLAQEFYGWLAHHPGSPDEPRAAPASLRQHKQAWARSRVSTSLLPATLTPPHGETLMPPDKATLTPPPALAADNPQVKPSPN
jgi:hypothetical protein